MYDWFGISCMTTDNFCFNLQNRQIQTNQTGDQQYSDTSPPLVFPGLSKPVNVTDNRKDTSLLLNLSFSINRKDASLISNIIFRKLWLCNVLKYRPLGLYHKTFHGSKLVCLSLPANSTLALNLRSGLQPTQVWQIKLIDSPTLTLNIRLWCK